MGDYQEQQYRAAPRDARLTSRKEAWGSWLCRVGAAIALALGFVSLLPVVFAIAGWLVGGRP